MVTVQLICAFVFTYAISGFLMGWLIYFSVLQHLYTIMCLPMLGHAVSLLLSISEVERARNLRILALECLLDLSQSDTKCKLVYWGPPVSEAFFVNGKRPIHKTNKTKFIIPH